MDDIIPLPNFPPEFGSRIEKLLAEIADATMLGELSKIRATVTGLHEAVRVSRLGREAQNACAEIRLRCDRKIGALLRGKPFTRGRPKIIPNGNDFRLDDVSISAKEALHFRRVSEIPERFFELFFRDAARFGWQITDAEFFRRTEFYQINPPIINAHLIPPRPRNKTSPLPVTSPPTIDLRHGDCLAIMSTMPTHSIDLILADLPQGQKRCAWDTLIDLAALWGEFKRILRPYHATVLMATQPFAAVLLVSNIEDFKSEMIWEKHRAPNFVHAQHRVMHIHENICVFSDGGASNRAAHPMPYYTPPDEPYPVSILYYPRDRPVLHPAQKPVALLRRFVELYTQPGQTVLDATMGSGSTGVAALQAGRNFIGIELDEHYFNVAADRLAEFT